MCGIAGFLGPFDADLLERMNNVQSHRGPDDSGVYYSPDEQVGMAHRRLSIIDLHATGHQPMTDVTASATIVFNGEIYNYRELRAELEAGGFVFRGHSDTEVLLNLYVRDGLDMLKRLNGIFAFAIWDHRDSTLFVARDGVGVKPLYYSELPSGFLFASELKAILESDDVPRVIDAVAVQHYMTYLWCPAPRTMLKDVQKLEPGCALVVTDGRVCKRWSFYDLPHGEPAQSMDQSEAIGQVGADVQRAVERQLVSDVPVGAFLSGGLDSSAIVALASRKLPGSRLQCFTIGFEDDAVANEGFAEDLPYARRVSKHLDVDLHTIYAGPETAQLMEAMIYHLDEPQADPAAIYTMLISRLANDNNIKVLLSGTGGDDIYSGYRRHRALDLERLWSWTPRPARSALSRAARSTRVRGPISRRFRKGFQYADYEDDRRMASYFSWIEPQSLFRLFSPALQEELAKEDPLAPLLLSLDRLPHTVDPLDRMLYLEGKHFLADHNLNYMDKMGMAEGVEIRVPLLDVDLIANAASLPSRYKQRGRHGKWVFKKAMEPYLPSEIIYRPKTGFGAPLRQWLRNQLREQVEDLLSNESLDQRGLFDPSRVREFLQLDRDGRVDGTYTIFALMSIELWCRIFLDRAT